MDSNLAATLQTLNKCFVIIGYGNDLRSDDAIGPCVAKAVEAWGVPNVDSLALQQLTPELADTLQDAYGAIFVDASSSPEVKEVEVLAIEPIESGKTMTHTSDPRSLLALTKALYGRYPHAWLVKVPAVNFELGESLSPIAQKGIDDALEEIDYLLRSQTYASCF
ncbi:MULTISPECIES: hydrogenase maturation protease [Aerosakkonema]|uniref:hydrogenase maturation protease n=1 Tax=Aerosakkonema TaxID=1246629 RepID=UPI0035BA4B9D